MLNVPYCVLFKIFLFIDEKEEYRLYNRTDGIRFAWRYGHAIVFSASVVQNAIRSF